MKSIYRWMIALALVFPVASNPAQLIVKESLGSTIYKNNGSRSVETVVKPGKRLDPDFVHVGIKVGTHVFWVKQFSPREDEYQESQLPRVERIQLWEGASLLLVTVNNPNSCTYHLLDPEMGLKSLLSFEGDGPCLHPFVDTPRGTITFFKHSGRLWPQPHVFEYLKTQHRLAEKAENVIEVDLSGPLRAEHFLTGVALRAFALRGEGCATTQVLRGTYIRVTHYDAERDAYRLTTIDGDCGWLSFDELTAPDSPVGGLVIGDG